MVEHCRAFEATGAPQTFFYNNKLQFSNLTTNRAVGSSNLSGRAIYVKKANHLAVVGFLVSLAFLFDAALMQPSSINHCMVGGFNELGREFQNLRKTEWPLLAVSGHSNG